MQNPASFNTSKKSSSPRTRTRKKRPPAVAEYRVPFFFDSLFKDLPVLQKLLEEASPEAPIRQALEKDEANLEKERAKTAEQQYQNTLLCGAADLAKRWERVATLLPALEELSSDTRVNRLTMPFRKVESKAVCAILFLCFLPPLVARARSHRMAPTAALKRRANKTRLLLEAEFSASQRKILRDRLHRTLKSIRENQERQQWLGPSCPALSAAITLLTTYLSQCLELSLRWKAADYYRTIGKIMGAFSSPQCPACGHQHPLSDWRRVKARDQYKGVWDTRHERGTIKAPGATPFGIQWDGYPFNLIDVWFFEAELKYYLHLLTNNPSSLAK